MKRLVEWYEKMLENKQAFYERRQNEAARLQKDVAICGQEILFLAEQIAEAKRRGMTGFDCDRLLVKRTKKE